MFWGFDSGCCPCAKLRRKTRKKLRAKGRIGKINNVGARDNAYSVSLGMLTYFNSKLVLRNKDYSTISESDLNDLCSHNSKVGIASDSILGKVFSYFFDN